MPTPATTRIPPDSWETFSFSERVRAERSTPKMGTRLTKTEARAAPNSATPSYHQTNPVITSLRYVTPVRCEMTV
jgi:hypothetical protein